MESIKEKVTYLFRQYINGGISAEDMAELDAWIEADQANRKLFDELTNPDVRHNELQNMGRYDEEAALEKFLKKRRNKNTKHYFFRNRKSVFVAAAAIIIMFFSTGLYFLLSQPQWSTQLAKTRVENNRIIPGGNKAVLTLSDGSQIILDNAQNGTLANQSNSAVTKVKDGLLIYDASLTSNKALKAEVVYNTISTPRGGQYQLVLPDGSKVWLNAASSLRFPTSFSDKERIVTLTGEGYFEVAKNPDKPFSVQAGGIRIQALGTHFNVMAYTDEVAVKTTLLEGSVKLSHSDMSVVLKPGEAGFISPNKGSFLVNEVDTRSATAWKDGYFRFENADLPELMRQLSRWYDVEIEYEGQIHSYEFVGRIERSSDLSKVLEILRSSDINFKIEEKKLIVKP